MSTYTFTYIYIYTHKHILYIYVVGFGNSARASSGPLGPPCGAHERKITYNTRTTREQEETYAQASKKKPFRYSRAARGSSSFHLRRVRRWARRGRDVCSDVRRLRHTISICLSLSLSIYLSIHPSIHLSIYLLYIYMYIYIYMSDATEASMLDVIIRLYCIL